MGFHNENYIEMHGGRDVVRQFNGKTLPSEYRFTSNSYPLSHIRSLGETISLSVCGCSSDVCPRRNGSDTRSLYLMVNIRARIAEENSTPEPSYSDRLLRLIRKTVAKSDY